jgi:hypothetical protein
VNKEQRDKVEQALASMPAAYFRVTGIDEASDGGLSIRLEMPQPEVLTDTDEWVEIAIPLYPQELEKLDMSKIYRVIGERALCIASSGEGSSGEYCYPGCPVYPTATTWDEMRTLDQEQGRTGAWETHYEEMQSTDTKERKIKDRIGGRAVSRFEIDY